MKQLLILFGCLISMTVTAQKFTVDANASSLNWTGHAQTGVYSPKGTLQIKSGTVTIRNGKLTAGTVVIDMTSLRTDNSEMQEHLRNEDFFDIEKFPTSTLILTSASGNKVTGKLTIKGITQPVTFQVSVNGHSIKVNMVIDRTLYGIKYNSASYFQDLGSYAIKNTFDIDVNLVAV